MQTYAAEADNKSYGGSTAHQPVTPPPAGYASSGVTVADVRSGGSAGGGLPQLIGFILRGVAIPMTFIATIVMGVNSQTTTVGLVGLVPVQAKLKAMNSSQLQYFVAANAIALAYASASLALSILNRRSHSSPGGKRLTLALTIVDVLMVVFLFSSIGSASAFSVAINCDQSVRFCRNMAAAIAMSAFGAAAFLALTVLAIIVLHTRSI